MCRGCIKGHPRSGIVIPSCFCAQDTRQTLSLCPPPQVIFFLDIQAESSPAVDGVTPGRVELDSYCVIVYRAVSF